MKCRNKECDWNYNYLRNNYTKKNSNGNKTV